jgi:hypothetical protein
MKKLLTKIIFSLIIILGSLSIDLFPITKSIIEKKICNINIDSVLASRKLSKHIIYLSKEELKEIIKMKHY